jgi:death-on-curing protein
MLTVLAMNGIELEYTQEELAEIVLRVAAGEKSFEDLHKWVLNHEV